MRKNGSFFSWKEIPVRLATIIVETSAGKKRQQLFHFVRIRAGSSLITFHYLNNLTITFLFVCEGIEKLQHFARLGVYSGTLQGRK